MNFKELEGKNVYLIPTGNNANRHKPDEYETGTITKVARVYLSIDCSGGGFESKYKFENGNNHILNDWNGGYLVFESIEALSTYKKMESISKKLAMSYSYQRDWMKVDSDDLFKIADILGISDEKEGQ